MTELDSGIGKMTKQSRGDTSSVIYNHDLGHVSCFLQEPEVLAESLLIFRWSQKHDRDIVSEIINTPEQGYFSFVSSDLNVFAVQNEDAGVFRLIYVFVGEPGVFRQSIKLCNKYFMHRSFREIVFIS